MYPDHIYDLALSFWAGKLWKSLNDSELFAVSLPGGEVGYCRVMGNEYPALNVYIGERGLDSCRFLYGLDYDLVNDLQAREFEVSQIFLQCAFVSQEKLSPEEMSDVQRFCKEHHCPLPDGGRLPRFLTCRAARLPCPIADEAEIRQLCAALEGALEVREGLERDDKEWLGFSVEAPDTIPLLTPGEEGITWSTHRLPPLQPVKNPEPSLNDEMLLQKLRSAKRCPEAWVCDVAMFPQPCMLKGETEPLYPYMLLTAVYETEQFLPTDYIGGYDSGAGQLLHTLARQMLENGVPRQINVTNARSHALVKQLASDLQIELVLREGDELLDGMEEDFLDACDTLAYRMQCLDET